MNYVSKGTELRLAIKELVFDYMKNSPIVQYTQMG